VSPFIASHRRDEKGVPDMQAKDRDQASKRQVFSKAKGLLQSGVEVDDQKDSWEADGLAAGTLYL